MVNRVGRGWLVVRGRNVRALVRRDGGGEAPVKGRRPRVGAGDRAPPEGRRGCRRRRGGRPAIRQRCPGKTPGSIPLSHGKWPGWFFVYSNQSISFFKLLQSNNFNNKFNLIPLSHGK